MTYAETCTEHDDCIVIVHEVDGQRVWASHAPASVRPETRVSLDTPDLEHDGKALTWDLATAEEAATLGWDDEARRQVAFVAGQKGLRPMAELATKAEVSVAELEREAKTKGWT